MALTLLACSAAPATSEAQDLQISAQPTLYPAFDLGIRDYVVRCASGTPVTVTVSAPAGTDVDVDGHGAAAGDFSTQVGLNPGQGFSIRVTSASGTTMHFARCLPADFPSWTWSRVGAPQAQWYLAAPVNGPYGIVFDRNGVPVWWLKARGSSLDFRLLSNRNAIFARNGGAGADEYRLDGTLVRTVQADAPATDAHEVQLLPNGNYLVASQRTVDGQTVCGQSNLTILDNGIQQVASDGSPAWSWWASDHIPLSDVPAAWCPTVLGGSAGSPKDPYHLNSIEPAADGYVVSFRHLDAIYHVETATGDVSWKLGGVAGAASLAVWQDPLSAAGDTFRGQHDARFLPDGSLTVYDNGFHPGGNIRRPRAVRFAIDPTARTATLFDQRLAPATVTSSLCCGSARTLPAGGWVINWGSGNLATDRAARGKRCSASRSGPRSATASSPWRQGSWTGTYCTTPWKCSSRGAIRGHEAPRS